MLLLSYGWYCCWNHIFDQLVSCSDLSKKKKNSSRSSSCLDSTKQSTLCHVLRSNMTKIHCKKFNLIQHYSRCQAKLLHLFTRLILFSLQTINIPYIHTCLSVTTFFLALHAKMQHLFTGCSQKTWIKKGYLTTIQQQHLLQNSKFLLDKLDIWKW